MVQRYKDHPIPDRVNKNGYVSNWIEKKMYESHEQYMLRRIREEKDKQYEHEPTAEKGYPKYESHEQYMLKRIREEEEATIRSLASSDTPSSIPEVNDIRQMLERIEKKIDKMICEN